MLKFSTFLVSTRYMNALYFIDTQTRAKKYPGAPQHCCQEICNFNFILFIEILCNYVCDVTLSVYPHPASLKNMLGHGGNLTYDLWNTSPMLCQLSYAVRSVRVSDISDTLDNYVIVV